MNPTEELVNSFQDLVGQVPDGRDLEYEVQGPRTGPVVLFHHGMPGSAVPMGTVLGSITARGFRVVTYSRAGYGASTPAPGRTVADTAADCAVLLAHLGVTRYLVVGWSAGGPHALASAAVAPESVEGVLAVASFAPFDAEGLDYVDGMGAQNVAQFGTAVHGESAMRELVGQMASAVRGHATSDVATEMASLLPPVDLAVLTAEYGADNAANMDHGLSRGDEGWVADLAALTSPWGFDLDAITVSVELWHGSGDQMVPVAHGRWLAEHLPTAQAHLEPGQGHLSLAIGSLGEKLEALSGRVADRTTPSTT
ncbi:alpha/beta fold hydrolase [Promicromonospora sp. NPDC057138]|uniref:alpha/beta fold hydrolase n=1 Tax=Promicromonospora sp. NPDC057138 TaxID=3346031 RepID=UPI00362D0A04